MKSFVVSPGSKVEVRELDDIVRDIYEIIGGAFEVVSPMLLRRPLKMLVDDCGLLKHLSFNAFGSYLYGTSLHGHPIVGTVAFVRECIRNGEADLVGLLDSDINYLTSLCASFC